MRQKRKTEIQLLSTYCQTTFTYYQRNITVPIVSSLRCRNTLGQALGERDGFEPGVIYHQSPCSSEYILATLYSSRLSFLFHLSMCMFLYQYHTVLITVLLQYSLKSGNVIPPTLFFLKIPLASQDFFVVPYKFQNYLFQLYEKGYGYFNRSCIKCADCFGQY